MADDIIWDDAPAEEIVWDAPPKPKKKEKPSLFRRSMNRAQLGASDVMSTLEGDNYGRSGDPTARDYLGPDQIATRVLGGIAIPAAAEIVADTAITAGKAVLPQQAEDAIAGGVNYVAGSRPVQALGRGLDAWKAASPDTYATAGEVGNIVTAFMPTKKLPIKDFGAGKRLAKSVAKTRAKEIANVFEPDKPITGKIKAGDYIEKPGLLQRTEFVPNKQHQKMLDEISSIPEIDPRRSAVKNREVLGSEINKAATSLTEKLKGEPPIAQQKVLDALDNAKDKIRHTPAIVGDAAASAEKYASEFEKIIRSKMVNGEITPNDLWQARMEFDRLVPKDTLTPGGTAGHATTKALRTELNNLIDTHAPNVGVKQDFDRMHQMMKANDYLGRLAEGEGRNRLTRALDTLENRTGFRHPATPRNATGTLTDMPSLLYSAGASMFAGGGKAIAEGAARNSVAAQRMLATALRESPELAAKGLLLDSANRKKKENK